MYFVRYLLGLSIFALAGFCGFLPGEVNHKTAVRIERVHTYKGFHKASFSPDSKFVALIDGNHVDLFEVESRKKFVSLVQPSSTILTGQFSPDSRLFAMSFKQNDVSKVTLWDVSSGREKLSLPVADNDWRRSVEVSFSPDGKLASNIGGIARLWDAHTGKEVRRFVPSGKRDDVEAERTMVSPNGKFFAAYFRSGKDPAYHQVHIWNLENGQEKSFATEVYLDWEFSVDSELVGLTAITDKGKPSERSVAEIWNTSTVTRKTVIEVPPEWRGAYAISFSPDSRQLAAGGYKKFGIFSIDTGQLLTAESHHGSDWFQDSQLPSQVSDIQFSRDSRLLVTSGHDRTVKLWRLSH